MHNVRKTPATEAHAANEVKRRAEKLKLYNALREQIFLKRDKDEDYNKRIIDLFEEELSLTKEALFANPKSYGAWHHRFWTFRNHPSANLQKELELCEKALSIDGRNFHCWDHRRSVAKLANLTEEEELKFSDKLIAQNPSNYSAWHYRATLLPQVRPDLNETASYKLPIAEDCLREEFEKAKNVCCMNSEDQTAWTYCRWLCEAAYSKSEKMCTREGPKKCLEELVDFCEELIKIDKEDVPWEVIALSRAKLYLTGPTLETVKELSKLFDKIKQLDPQRKSMYDDLLRRIQQQSIECAEQQI